MVQISKENASEKLKLPSNINLKTRPGDNRPTHFDPRLGLGNAKILTKTKQQIRVDANTQ